MIVILAMGGIVLRNGVKSSGLMDIMDSAIHRMLEGCTLYSVIVMLSDIVLVCPHFVLCRPLSLIPPRSS
jgi:di/tricarboxylate transporter